VNPARLVAGNDPTITGEGAAPGDRIARESGHCRPRFQVPHLQRPVPRSGDRSPPVPTYCHPEDRPGVLFQLLLHDVGIQGYLEIAIPRQVVGEPIDVLGHYRVLYLLGK